MGVRCDLSVILVESTQNTMSKVKEIITLYFGQMQPERIQQKFFHWLKNPDSSQDKEGTLTQLWEEISDSADLSTEKSYRQVEQRLGLSVKRNSTRLLYMRIARVAAVFLTPVLSILSAWLYVENQQYAKIEWVEQYVPNGETREIKLPDNSLVLINSGSILFYQKDFKGKVRNLYLSGKAKFTVSPDKKKPFIVRTNDMSVEALGTIFNISSYPDDSHTIATLIEGKVGVDIASTENEFILSPGEQIVYNKETGKSLKREARIDYVLAWEKGQMVFQSVSLYSIVKELERHYGVTVYLNAAGLSDEKLTVKFLHDESLEEILRVLQQIITGFNYKIEGDKIFIY